MSDPILELKQVEFGYGETPVLSALDMHFGRGQVVAVMGGSGCGKTTVLRLIGGLVRARRGQVLFEGQDVGTLDAKGLYAVRRRMGMLFQFGALFTDMSVFDNVAFPLQEHTDLSEEMIRDLVLMKLNAVGLRGARELTPRRNLGRHGAARGACARDHARSFADHVRRAVCRARPDLAGHHRESDPHAQSRARRDPRSSLRTMSLNRLRSPITSTSSRTAGSMRRARPPSCAHRPTRSSGSSSTPRPTAPFKFHYANAGLDADFGFTAAASREKTRVIEAIGRGFIGTVSRVGHGACMFVKLLWLVLAMVRRPRLVMKQIHFLGNYSLLIIGVSGLFVGFVLGLQGYYTLNRYGPSRPSGCSSRCRSCASSGRS